LCSAHAITADVSIAETAKAAEFFISDGVIVTGAATAIPADLNDLRSVKKSVKIPVLIGKSAYSIYIIYITLNRLLTALSVDVAYKLVFISLLL
jgi:predicted TIM-barrel enzyme